MAQFGCQTGTVHRTAEGGTTLLLIAWIGVPDTLLEKIRSIPFGKGIAGAAAAERRGVQLCNLQQDLGGVAKPRARETGVRGSLAVPIMDEKNNRVLGVIGIGKHEAHDFSEEETSALSQAAEGIFECP